MSASCLPTHEYGPPPKGAKADLLRINLGLSPQRSGMNSGACLKQDSTGIDQLATWKEEKS